MNLVKTNDVDVNVPLYVELFKTRDDCFAVQRRDGSYGPLNIEFDTKHVEEHVNGERTYGQYLVNPDDNTVAFAVIDNDIDDDSDAPLENALKAAVLEKRRAINFGLKENQVWLEFSGRRGYHTWFFFDPPVKAAVAKELLETIVGNEHDDRMRITIDGGHLEVFPKQSGIAEGEYGNLVKTPWGFHQKTGNRMVFVDEDGTPFDDQAAIVRASLRNRIHPDACGGILEEFGHDPEQLVEKAEKRVENRGQATSDVVNENLDIRPVIQDALDRKLSAPHDKDCELIGDQGHNMRLAIAAELLNNGYSVKEADELFKVFPNYDQATTRNKLTTLKRSGHKPWKGETLRSKCPDYVEGYDLTPMKNMDVVDSMKLNHERYNGVYGENK